MYDKTFPSTAVILVPHGTREQAGVNQSLELCVEVFQELNRNFQRLPPFYVGFLEIARPSLEEMLESVVRNGNQKVVVVPIMLFDADHIKKDIPAIIRRAIESYADKSVTVYITSAYGMRWRLLGLAMERQKEVLADGNLTREQTAYVMVARGTSDEAALRQVETVYELIGMTGYAHRKLCYFAAAEPRVEDVLEQVAQLEGIRSVLVQPYLLFEGYLTNHLRDLLEQSRQKWPHLRWVQTDVLWPSSSLVHILAEKVSDALLSSQRDTLPHDARVLVEGVTKSNSGSYRIVALPW
jgi:sirohydrochlorin ferrochelatase